jgi:hypothetical protein
VDHVIAGSCTSFSAQRRKIFTDLRKNRTDLLIFQALDSLSL